MVRKIHLLGWGFKINMVDSRYGKIEDYKEELREITQLVKKLRTMKKGKITQWDKPAEWHMKYSNLHGESVLCLTVTLSPTGCEWARNGGCTMCGEFEGAYKRKDLLDNPKFHISQFVAAITDKEVISSMKKEGKPISWIRINQEGNFTNPKETNPEAQEKILRLATQIKGVKKITIESRPQYLPEKTIAFLSNISKSTGVEIEVGMGLEAEDDIVRNVCINKNGTKEQFVRTLNLMKKYDVLSLAYILLKPPFLTEKEAIDEAIRTAHFAAEIGFSRISFEPMSIHCYTLTDLLKEANQYKAPWLWSVVEVARACKDISHIFGIGGVGYYPVPSEYAHNYCTSEDNCNFRIVEAIKVYNRSRDVSCFEGLDCLCKEKWREDCEIEAPELHSRIKEQISKCKLILEEYNPPISNDNLAIREQRIIAGGSQ